MPAGLPDDCDAFNVLLMNAKVGATDGNGDASLHGAITGDDLNEHMQCVVGRGVGGGSEGWGRECL